MARAQFQTLTEPMFYILLCLQKEVCGIDIMVMVSVISNGRVSIGPGTLYAMLQKFEDNEIIEKTREENRKKWYLITDAGKQMLEDELKRLGSMLSDAKSTMKNN